MVSVVRLLDFRAEGLRCVILSWVMEIEVLEVFYMDVSLFIQEYKRVLALAGEFNMAGSLFRRIDILLGCFKQKIL